MDKTLQDLAWRSLPKEFKEEVKRMYETAKSYVLGDIEINAQVCEAVLSELFGIHNLTSDAEGEEMLTVSRKKVQELREGYKAEYDAEDNGSINKFSLCARISMLEELFGSKCMLDAPSSNFCQIEGSATNVEGVQTSASTEPKPKISLGNIRGNI